MYFLQSDKIKSIGLELIIVASSKNDFSRLLVSFVL